MCKTKLYLLMISAVWKWVQRNIFLRISIYKGYVVDYCPHPTHPQVILLPEVTIFWNQLLAVCFAVAFVFSCQCQGQNKPTPGNWLSVMQLSLKATQSANEKSTLLLIFFFSACIHYLRPPIATKHHVSIHNACLFCLILNKVT